jgi:hypothetical protein
MTVVAAVAAGCSISAQRSPQLINEHQVPFGLLQVAPSTTVPQSPSVGITIYLVLGEHLVTVNRAVPAPGTLSSALRVLGRGTTGAEAAANLESPISTATPLILRAVDGSTAVVDVAASFSELSGKDQILAAAQLVYTLTQFPGIDEVSIRIGGQPAQVPTSSGRVHSGPLNRAAYRDLAPI